MQGLGNDFVVLDYEEYKKTNKTPQELALKLCDRHFGIGADGLIIVNPDTKEFIITDSGDYVSPGVLYYFNADGTLKWKQATGDVPGHIVFFCRIKNAD